MIKVAIASTVVRRQQGIGKVSGKPYDMTFQDAYFYTVDKDGTVTPFPQKVEIILPKDKDGAAMFFAPGNYQLSPSSLQVDRNGKLVVEPMLVPLAAATARPTSAA